ncbi:MAG: DNA polymerase/3'-5' exonuclease PolX [Candidatus Micrarchaeota archaeon]|nr:DNA polymerase/3'-5' exonuclease PolX [Candidatus Micrarchaeota archaeon]MDE1804818.1 DNA polymerase/3'-5' exonuclease PolX [Candidatus Micrarchaeota archaeon]MDE1847102.1 DNA polymerase/3'-5' exonuclease PolX [Candidatus Micrarchaeota archaeon]
MSNKKLAEIFEEIASMLDLEGENRFFEVRAYRKAAMTVGTMQQEVEDIYRKGGEDALRELPGIGKAIASHIAEYYGTGKIKKYEELKRKYPVDFTGLTRIQGMGARKAFKLYKALGVKNLEDLKKAIEKHKVRDLEGFGEKSEQEIAKGIQFLSQGGGRMLLGVALPVAEAIVSQLKESGSVDEAIVAGSTRRMRETVGDLDILVISEKQDAVEKIITGMKEVQGIIARGPTKISVILKVGLNCDFRIIEKKSFGAALQYFTGSKDHSVQLRQIAVKKGYSLNEYQLSGKNGENIASRTEADVYNRLGLDYIEPEMREARGEIELALAHNLPKLIELKDIRGDLHSHANPLSGVTDKLEDVVGAAMKLGYEYIGITNHSKSLYVEKGLNDRQMQEFFKAVDKMNDRLDGKIRILKSAETDILKDGTLDLGKKTLEQMDYVLAAVHANTNMGKGEMTKRVVMAIEENDVHILGHPTGRLINKREPIQLDLDKVFEAAKENGVAMEIDAQPDRLDLNDESVLRARKYGLKFSIDSDTHWVDQMQLMRYGVGTARRGWLTKGDVINSLPLEKLLKQFRK